VIATVDGPLDMADYNDEYREVFARIVDARIAGEEIVAPDCRGVVNMMDALKKSLDAVSGHEEETRERRGSPTSRERKRG
jgi:non-homologous end joining protein Ku